MSLNHTANYDIVIMEMKAIRAMYEFCQEYGNLNIDYGGEVKRLGDQVMIRPTPDILKGMQRDRTLRVDKVLPSNDLKLQFLMNLIDWEHEGDLVIVCVDHKFLVGYQRVD